MKEFILNNELIKKQIDKIVFSTLRIWIGEDYSKVELVEELEEFYYKFPSIKHRPIFLDDLMNVPD